MDVGLRVLWNVSSLLKKHWKKLWIKISKYIKQTLMYIKNNLIKPTIYRIYIFKFGKIEVENVVLPLVFLEYIIF